MTQIKIRTAPALGTAMRERGKRERESLCKAHWRKKCYTQPCHGWSVCADKLESPLYLFFGARSSHPFKQCIGEGDTGSKIERKFSLDNTIQLSEEELKFLNKEISFSSLSLFLSPRNCHTTANFCLLFLLSFLLLPESSLNLWMCEWKSLSIITFPISEPFFPAVRFALCASPVHPFLPLDDDSNCFSL